MTIHDDIAEARAYADKGPALSRATAGRLVDEIEARQAASDALRARLESSELEILGPIESGHGMDGGYVVRRSLTAGEVQALTREGYRVAPTGPLHAFVWPNDITK